METSDPVAHEESDKHRRLKAAHAIFEENSGPLHKLLGQTRHNPFAAVAIGVLVGIVIGIAASRD